MLFFRYPTKPKFDMLAEVAYKQQKSFSFHPPKGPIHKIYFAGENEHNNYITLHVIYIIRITLQCRCKKPVVTNESPGV